MANALFAGDTSPVYLRPDEPIPEDVDSQRVIFLKRVFVDPPERDEGDLPRVESLQSPAIERAVPRFSRKLELPPNGVL
jgi:hypothetical protein